MQIIKRNSVFSFFGIFVSFVEIMETHLFTKKMFLLSQNGEEYKDYNFADVYFWESYINSTLKYHQSHEFLNAILTSPEC